LGTTSTLIGHQEELTDRCSALAEGLIGELQADLTPAIAGVEKGLPPDHRQRLRREYTRWAGTDAWRLINAGDPCGT
jgi:hypothetical protein